MKRSQKSSSPKTSGENKYVKDECKKRNPTEPEKA